MAGEIHVIRVDANGNVDTDPCRVRIDDEIHWIPTTSEVKLKIKFDTTKPMGWKQRPRIPAKGKVAKGTVSSGRGETHPYQATGARRAIGRRADPVIIVRGDRLKKGRKKAPARKLARKK